MRRAVCHDSDGTIVSLLEAPLDSDDTIVSLFDAPHDSHDTLVSLFKAPSAKTFKRGQSFENSPSWYSIVYQLTMVRLLRLHIVDNQRKYIITFP